MATPTQAGDLAALLAGLPRAAGPKEFSSAPLAANAHLARDHSGRPAIVFELSKMPGRIGRSLSGIRLELIAEAVIHTGGKTRTAGIAAVVSQAPEFDVRFNYLAADALRLTSGSSTALDSSTKVRAFLREWTDLFRPKDTLDKDGAVGLWGELETLLRLPDLERGVEVWHGPLAGDFDFGAAGVLLEVKTSLSGHRHHFSLKQLEPPATAPIYVRSLVLREDPASGESLRDLIGRIRHGLVFEAGFIKKLAKLGVDVDAPPFEELLLVEKRTVTVPALRIPRPAVSPADYAVLDQVRFRASVAGIRQLDTRRRRQLLADLVS